MGIDVRNELATLQTAERTATWRAEYAAKPTHAKSSAPGTRRGHAAGVGEILQPRLLGQRALRHPHAQVADGQDARRYRVRDDQRKVGD